MPDKENNDICLSNSKGAKNKTAKQISVEARESARPENK